MNETLNLNSCVMGIGRCGINALNKLIEKPSMNVFKSMAVDNDNETLDQTLALFKIKLVGDTFSDCNKILTVLSSFNKIVILVGLGGEFGSIIAPLITCISNGMGINTEVVATVPFNYEGPRRTKRAGPTIKYIQRSCNSPKILYNQHILLKAGKEMSVNEAFQLSYKLMINSIKI